MNQRTTAIILGACALMFAIGAYILFSDDKTEESVHRQEILPPDESAQAPAWVDTGQKAEPDYSSSNMDAHNATPVPEPKEEKSPSVIEVREDKIVTFTFVESLADFMLHRFEPQDKHGKPATHASAKKLNVYYGQELDGFAVQGDDIRVAREAVYDYAFTPKMLKVLYELYGTVFVTHLADTAISDEREYKVNGQTERRTLTPTETMVMLRLNAGRIDQTARVLRAIANDPQITTMAGQFIQTAKAVERANAQLQTAIAEEKSTAIPSKRLKQAILQREEIKKSITMRLKKACPDCPDTDLFYLAQWGYRRILNEPDKKLESFSVAADVLTDLAKQFRTAADELKE